MRKKFPILLVPLMCFLALGSYVAKAGENQVLLTLTDGDAVTMSFSQTPKITLSDGSVVVEYDEDGAHWTIYYAPSAIKKVSFGAAETVGIESAPDAVKPGNIDFSNGVFTFSGFKGGDRVYLYNIGGVKVNSYTIPSNGSVEVSTSSLPAGIYVITINGLTYKFNKR
jgi:hypothetical protein